MCEASPARRAAQRKAGHGPAGMDLRDVSRLAYWHGMRSQVVPCPLAWRAIDRALPSHGGMRSRPHCTVHRNNMPGSVKSINYSAGQRRTKMQADSPARTAERPARSAFAGRSAATRAEARSGAKRRSARSALPSRRPGRPARRAAKRLVHPVLKLGWHGLVAFKNTKAELPGKAPCTAPLIQIRCCIIIVTYSYSN